MMDSRKTFWLTRLNKYDADWEDGDLNNRNLKSADLINTNRNVAIELKLFNLSGNTDFSSIQSESILSKTNLSNRLRSDARDANNKFKNYPGYKTILLIETDFPTAFLLDVFEGTNHITISESNAYNTRKNEFLSPRFIEIGWYFIFSTWGGQNGADLKAMVNPYAKKERLLSEQEVRNIFNRFLPPIDFNLILTYATHC